MKKIKRIRFVGLTDRIGMAYDVLGVLASLGINIITMELNPPYISFKVDWGDISWDDFKNHIKKEIQEIQDVIQIDIMEYEKREKELQTIINSMDEGLIATDQLGTIVYLNKKAQKLFDIKDCDANMHINEIISKKYYNPVTDKKDKNNIEIRDNIRKNKVNILSDIKLIKNEFGVKTGALIILREMTDIKRIMQSITRPSMITFEDIIAESDIMKETIAIAKSVAPTDSSVMILGESGTGKELFARAIHMESNRNSGPFIAVNCAAIPDTLLESEFFGYEKGAFTGASSSGKQGFFELADGGTLFLDEIGDLPTHLQAKILRAIQERKIRRIGGNKEIVTDFRVISATHRDIIAMIKEGTFREDLYYRLNVIPITIPPLRKRKEDIIVLAKHFTKVLGAKIDKSVLEISDIAIDKLMKYDWPGNVRELQNVIERSVILAKDKIDYDNILINKKELEGGIKTDKKSINDSLPINLPKVLEDIENRYLKIACKKYNSSRKIAKALGISHTTVINKIEKYGIQYCKQ